MHLREKVKLNLIDKNVPLFLLRGKVILEALFCGFLIVALCSFLSGAAIFCKNDFVLAIIFTFACYVVFLYFHIVKSPYRKNIDTHGYENIEIEKNVILSSSNGISSWRLQNTVNWIGLFLSYEGACYQKCVFRKGDDFSETDYFYYVLTKRRAKILTKLYSGKIGYWDYGIYPKEIEFLSGIPLRLVYSGKNHYFKRLMPVDGYQYTAEEIALIREFNESDRIGKRTIEQRTFVVYWGILISLILLSFGISFFAVVVLKFVLALVINFGSIVPFLFLGVSVAGIICLLELGDYVWRKKFRADENTRDYVSEDVLIRSSYIPRYVEKPTGRFHYIFREEHAMCYALQFVPIKSESKFIKDQEDRCYCVLTNDKVSLLRTLADIDIRFSFYVWCEVLTFKSCVPLKITYGKRSRILKSIAPAEGYAYTEAQLAAIEKFNTLYP